MSHRCLYTRVQVTTLCSLPGTLPSKIVINSAPFLFLKQICLNRKLRVDLSIEERKSVSLIFIKDCKYLYVNILQEVKKNKDIKEFSVIKILSWENEKIKARVIRLGRPYNSKVLIRIQASDPGFEQLTKTDWVLRQRPVLAVVGGRGVTASFLLGMVPDTNTPAFGWREIWVGSTPQQAKASAFLEPSSSFDYILRAQRCCQFWLQGGAPFSQVSPNWVACQLGTAPLPVPLGPPFSPAFGLLCVDHHVGPLCPCWNVECHTSSLHPCSTMSLDRLCDKEPWG